MAVEFAWAALFGFVFDIEMDELSGYVIETDRAFKLAAEALDKKIDQETDGKSAGLKQDIIERYHDSARELTERFPSIGNAATFVMIYSFFEHELWRVCEKLQSVRGYELGPGDVNGSGIEQSVKYLQKMCGIPVPKQSTEWQKIKQMQKVRNIIVHRRGLLRLNDDLDVRAYIKSTSTIRLGSYDQMILSKQHCLDSVQVVKAFMAALLDLMPTDE